MSDEKAPLPPPPPSNKGRIFYGSLDKVAAVPGAVKADAGAAAPADDDDEVPVVEGNINIHDTASGTEVMELSHSSLLEQDKHADMLQRVEAKKRARSMVVPTKLEEVQASLRGLGQPVRLFGETVADVRVRLREYLATLELAGEERAKVEEILAGASALTKPAAAAAKEKKGSSEVVYTPAGEDLQAARRAMANFSFPKSRERLRRSKRRREEAKSVQDQQQKEEGKNAADVAMVEKLQRIRQMAIGVSTVGDERPLSALRCAPDGSLLACGSWRCMVQLWDAKSLEQRGKLRGHTERITGVSWHPMAFGTASMRPLVATASADKTAKLWDADTCEEKLTLSGHADRLGRLEFHPSGDYLGTASFDHTWRLWDVETGKQLLLQDGHDREVYSISFQEDGALVATTDFGGVAHLWDLRSGKSVFAMTGHVKKITCSDFSPSGYHLATGSDDHTVKIWDLRKRGCVYVLPAHTALVSDVRFGRSSGEVLASSGFDNTIKVWSARDFGLCKILTGHEGKVSAIDFSPDESRLLSCSFDRTIKVWEECQF